MGSEICILFWKKNNFAGGAGVALSLLLLEQKRPHQNEISRFKLVGKVLCSLLQCLQRCSGFAFFPDHIRVVEIASSHIEKENIIPTGLNCFSH